MDEGRLCSVCLSNVETHAHWYFLPCFHALCAVCFEDCILEAQAATKAAAPDVTLDAAPNMSSPMSSIPCRQKITDDGLVCCQRYFPSLNGPGGVFYFDNFGLEHAGPPEVLPEQNMELFVPVLETIKLRIDELRHAIDGMHGAITTLDQRHHHRADEVRKHYDDVIHQYISCGAQPVQVEKICQERDNVIANFLLAAPSLVADAKALRDQCDELVLFLDRMEFLSRTPYKTMRTGSLHSNLDTHVNPFLKQQLSVSLAVFTSVDVEFDMHASEVVYGRLEPVNHIARIVQRRNFVHGACTLALSWCGRNYHMAPKPRYDFPVDEHQHGLNQEHDDDDLKQDQQNVGVHAEIDGFGHDDDNDDDDPIGGHVQMQPVRFARPLGPLGLEVDPVINNDDHHANHDDLQALPVRPFLGRPERAPIVDAFQAMNWEDDEPVPFWDDDAAVLVADAGNHHPFDEAIEFDNGDVGNDHPGNQRGDGEDDVDHSDEQNDFQETESIGGRDIFADDDHEVSWDREWKQCRKEGRVFNLRANAPNPYMYNYVQDICFDNFGKVFYIICDEGDYGSGDEYVCRTDRSGEMLKVFKKSVLCRVLSKVLGFKVSKITYRDLCDISSSGDVVLFVNVESCGTASTAAIATTTEFEGGAESIDQSQPALELLITCDSRGETHRVLDVRHIGPLLSDVKLLSNAVASNPFFKVTNLNSCLCTSGSDLVSFDLFGKLLWKISLSDSDAITAVTELVAHEVHTSFTSNGVIFAAFDIDGYPMIRPREATSEERDSEKVHRIRTYQRTGCVYIPSTGAEPDMVAVVSKYQVRLIDSNSGMQLRVDTIIHSVSKRMKDVVWALSYDPVAKVGLVFGNSFDVSISASRGLFAVITFSRLHGSVYSEPNHDIFALGGITHAAVDPLDNAMVVFAENYNQRGDDWDDD